MPVLHAELMAENCPAELWLNGIPLARLSPEGTPYTSVPAQMYVVDGENSLELIAGTGPEPARVRESSGTPLPGNAEVRAALKALEVGQFTGDEALILMRADWSGAGQGNPPHIVNATANLGRQFGAWAWQSAPRLQLDEPTMARVRETLERIRLGFERGDAAVLTELVRPKFEALARAFPVRPYPETVLQFRRVVERYVNMPGWAMQPLDPKEFSFRLVGGGRLVECINTDWKAAIRSVPVDNGIPYFFSMTLGMSGKGFAVFL